MSERHARRGGIAGHHFTGQVRTGQQSDRRWVMAHQRLADHLGHPLTGARFEALGDADDQGLRIERPARLTEDAPHVRRGHSHHDDIGPGDSRGEIDGGGQLAGQREPWQEGRVLVTDADGVGDVLLTGPDRR